MRFNHVLFVCLVVVAPLCTEGLSCLRPDCAVECEHSVLTESGCPTCTCCPKVTCRLHCPDGFALQENGCPECKCKEKVTCGKGEMLNTLWNKCEPVTCESPKACPTEENPFCVPTSQPCISYPCAQFTCKPAPVKTTQSPTVCTTKECPAMCGGQDCRFLKCAVSECEGGNDSFGCTGKPFFFEDGTCTCVKPKDSCGKPNNCPDCDKFCGKQNCQMLRCPVGECEDGEDSFGCTGRAFNYPNGTCTCIKPKEMCGKLGSCTKVKSRECTAKTTMAPKTTAPKETTKQSCARGEALNGKGMCVPINCLSSNACPKGQQCYAKKQLCEAPGPCPQFVCCGQGYKFDAETNKCIAASCDAADACSKGEFCIPNKKVCIGEDCKAFTCVKTDSPCAPDVMVTSTGGMCIGGSCDTSMIVSGGLKYFSYSGLMRKNEGAIPDDMSALMKAALAKVDVDSLQDGYGKCCNAHFDGSDQYFTFFNKKTGTSKTIRISNFDEAPKSLQALAAINVASIKGDGQVCTEKDCDKVCMKGEELVKSKCYCVPVSCLSKNACKEDEVCTPTKRMCAKQPCQQFTCSPKTTTIPTTECDTGEEYDKLKEKCVAVSCKSPNACGKGETCKAANVKCVRSPCPQFICESSGKSCSTPTGTVEDGWEGYGEGSNCCNKCMCTDGLMHCTKRACIGSCKCTLSAGTMVENGWSGKDEGSNCCNTCNCEGGSLSCTEMVCSKCVAPETTTTPAPDSTNDSVSTTNPEVTKPDTAKPETTEAETTSPKLETTTPCPPCAVQSLPSNKFCVKSSKESSQGCFCDQYDCTSKKIQFSFAGIDIDVIMDEEDKLKEDIKNKCVQTNGIDEEDILGVTIRVESSRKRSADDIEVSVLLRESLSEESTNDLLTTLDGSVFLIGGNQVLIEEIEAVNLDVKSTPSQDAQDSTQMSSTDSATTVEVTEQHTDTSDASVSTTKGSVSTTEVQQSSTTPANAKSDGSGDDDSTTTITIVVVALVVIALLIVVVVLVVQRQRKSTSRQQAFVNPTYDSPPNNMVVFENQDADC
eukprot:m.333003 g.333003  ORF g.333003 m.333003 type:complete len:1046 (+) comp17044_c0_seq1:127-3264(+)